MREALRETLFILEALRKSLLHNRTNPRQDWRFLWLSAHIFTPSSMRIDDVTTHAKFTDNTQRPERHPNTMKIHNDWLWPARHLNRWCIEKKIIITKKKRTSNLQPKLHILKLISGHELFRCTDQLKEFPTTFREIFIHKSTDLSHYQYLNLLSRNKRILNPYFGR